MARVDDFFAFARKRHAIYLARKAGKPRSEWTDDPILQNYRFTNVFRELDRTTIWFRENVREPMRSDPEVLLATVVFRWFNRIETGEIIFKDRSSYLHRTPYEQLKHEQTAGALMQALIAVRPDGPHVTGSYIIKTPEGFSKLAGVCRCIEWFMYKIVPPPSIFHGDYRVAGVKMMQSRLSSLETVWEWLRQHAFLGDFTAYEIVTDLRHTDMLCDAPDIMTWCNPGPGAVRGLNAIHERDVGRTPNKKQTIAEIRDLLVLSVMPSLWPLEYPDMEMRDIEHTLCEFYKYEKARTGTGRPRQVFRELRS